MLLCIFSPPQILLLHLTAKYCWWRKRNYTCTD